MKEWGILAVILTVAAAANCGSSKDSADTAEVGADMITEVQVVETVAPEDALDAADHSADVAPATTPGGLPLAPPFELVREDVGEPLTAEEIAHFTSRTTGFLKQVDYFVWVNETCHGMDASTGYPDYLIWWHDVDAVKEGDTVTFRNNSAYGGSHNNAEPTSMVLAFAIGGYLLTGDEDMGLIVEQFAKSFTATMKGFVWDENDPEQYIMSRNIVTHNHEFVLPSGKKKAVDYTDWYSTYEGWNAHRFHYPNNPTWGDIYVTTMRSKDDVPLMYRAAAWFPYVVELAPDESVREAAAEALEYMQGFARDVVDSGYMIRSKDDEGNAYVPKEDLASLIGYTSLIPDAECDARLGCALMGYSDPLDNECGDGQGSEYDSIAGAFNYFNYSIVDHFHLSALQLALTQGHEDVAHSLLQGVITRLERYQDPDSDEPGKDDPDWQKDIALLLIEAAALGMPLTSTEARLVHKYHLQAVERYETFPNWDLWDDSVPDGVYDFRQGFHPKHGPDAIRIEEMGFILEYCWSPFRNKSGVQFVDCDVVADPAQWGE